MCSLINLVAKSFINKEGYVIYVTSSNISLSLPYDYRNDNEWEYSVDKPVENLNYHLIFSKERLRKYAMEIQFCLKYKFTEVSLILLVYFKLI